MMDLDRFKLINDTHGHPVGDEVLRHVAGLLAGQIRHVDCVARLGGDEFALLLVESDHRGAQVVASRVTALAATNPYQMAAKQLTIEIGISAGVAAWPKDADTPVALVAAADAALYVVKRNGRRPA